MNKIKLKIDYISSLWGSTVMCAIITYGVFTEKIDISEVKWWVLISAVFVVAYLLYDYNRYVLVGQEKIEWYWFGFLTNRVEYPLIKKVHLVTINRVLYIEFSGNQNKRLGLIALKKLPSEFNVAYFEQKLLVND